MGSAWQTSSPTCPQKNPRRWSRCSRSRNAAAIVREAVSLPAYLLRLFSYEIQTTVEIGRSSGPVAHTPLNWGNSPPSWTHCPPSPAPVGLAGGCRGVLLGRERECRGWVGLRTGCRSPSVTSWRPGPSLGHLGGTPVCVWREPGWALSRKVDQTLTWAPPLGGGMVGKPEHLLADFHEYTKKAHREHLFYEELALCHFL